MQTCFYVIDRTDGKLVSAKPYVEVTWAKEIDPKTGRPIPNPDADYRNKTALVKPSMYSGHNWQPMSFNPATGLVYIPAQEIPAPYGMEKDFAFRPGGWNTGTDFALIPEVPRALVSGHLLAWDPVKQREAWRVPHVTAWNGGTLVDNSVYENKGMAFKGGIPVNRETIEERIGVRTRMAAPLDERIGLIAFQDLLDTSGIDPARIRVLIAATNVGEDKFDPGFQYFLRD